MLFAMGLNDDVIALFSNSSVTLADNKRKKVEIFNNFKGIIYEQYFVV